MRRALFTAIIALLLFLPVSAYSIDSADTIETYRMIPDITDEEIESIEALKSTRDYFTYAEMFETEAFVLPDGSIKGFTPMFCELLSDLFGIEFILEIREWDSLIDGINNKSVDFTGDLTPTTERMSEYYMSHPIAERSQRLFYHKDRRPITTETDVNGMTIGFLSGSIDSKTVTEAYPELSFKVVEVEGFEAAAEMIQSGKIDAFACEGVIDPFFSETGYIVSREFFPLVYTPVSLTTANPELRPIITALNKYLASGGIEKLIELYKAGDSEYAQYKLGSSFTQEEHVFIDKMAASGGSVNIALENDNYPISFYNSSEKKFQGIAVDVLDEITRLTGLKFNVVNDENTTWTEMLEMVKSADVAMVSQLLKTDEREGEFLWSSEPYASANYLLLSKSDYPHLAIYQVVMTSVGAVVNSAFAEKYYEWFPESSNLVLYETQDDMLEALENNKVDLLMTSDYMLLMQLNYREKPGYMANIRFNAPIESYFGFNKKETLLKSIIDKAQAFVETGDIERNWTSRAFDYSKKLAQQQLIMMTLVVAVLLLVLSFTVYYLMRNKRISQSLELLVKKRTSELERQTEAAQVASVAKGSFLARMSHEIRTPLNAIIGMANIARNSIENREKAMSSINQIITSSHHLLGILNDVLDMSKIESGKLELSHETFGIVESYAEVSNIIAQRCVEKNIRFAINMEDIEDVHVVGDKLRLNQVLINLLGNAVKFTPVDGTVTFSVKVLENDGSNVRVHFSVSDTGIGMSEEQKAKLFIPFEQADNTIAAKFGGTGLGLSISQNLIGMMGGKIEVESVAEEGSEFFFTLDFERADVIKESFEYVEYENLDLTGKRILLVEDIEVNRIIINELLGPCSAEIIEVENGLEAVEIFNGAKEGYFDIVLMDVQMPVLNGYEATRRIRELRHPDARKTPIVAMTANAYKEDVEEAIASGMNGHLAKPIDIDALMSTLAKYLIKNVA